MTAEGRLSRGKVNYEAGIFLDNAETMAYAATLKVEKPKEVVEDVKPKSRRTIPS